MASTDLVWPRVIYRGHPDTLGKGPHAHPQTGEPVGETKRCESAAQFDTDEEPNGWRLTREIPADDVDEDKDEDEDPPGGAGDELQPAAGGGEANINAGAGTGAPATVKPAPKKKAAAPKKKK